MKMNNTEANRKLLDSLNVKYKVCSNTDCRNLLMDYKKHKLYCGEKKCNQSLKNRDLVRKESRRVYPVQKCTVGSCNDIGDRHHEDYTQTTCLFLCPNHHLKLHKLKRRAGKLDRNMIQHFLLGNIG